MKQLATGLETSQSAKGYGTPQPFVANLHSGIIGDYVIWILVDVVLLGAALM
jgi:hypothetical protein